jgi:hypothetical protein
MLCHGVKFGYTALMEASGRGHAAVVQALIGAGADINQQNKASSALHELCYHSCLRVGRVRTGCVFTAVITLVERLGPCCTIRN